jgi:hypothetical protein
MRIRGFAGLVLWAIAGPAFGQAAAAYDPVGVNVDPKGVLRSRTTDPDPRLADLWKKAKSLPKEGKLLYVSLPRLLAQARELLERGRPLPADVRYLGGMTKLRYIFLYPEEKDLVIAGPAEPFDPGVAFRPLGQISGRPVLHLDDLVTALRAFAPGRSPDRLGCDIELTPEIRERAAAKATAVGPAASVLGFRKVCDQISEAAGPQPVKYYGMETDTRFAFVCVEADYRLKELALGLLPSPVPKVESYRSLVRLPEKEYRFSLESNYDALLADPGGNAFELTGSSLRVNGGLLGRPESTVADLSPAARQFVTECNENLEALLRHLLSWADLGNLGDLAVLGALVAGDRLAEKAQWDLSWLLDPKGYPVRAMPTPLSASTLCNFTVVGPSAIFLTGGVWIKPREWAQKRRPDPKVVDRASRPVDGWSLLRK